tara:strand:+ start:4135 stop:5892 length:1758 start_codon:yes stop_codon:yes gene_type:complete
MIRKKFFKISFFELLFKILGLINRNGQRKLNFLFVLVVFQAIFEVISIASLVPLIQIITNKNKLELYIQNSIKSFNLDYLINFDQGAFSIWIPLFVVLIMSLSTIVKLYVVFRTNKFIEETRHQISSRLMSKYINSQIELNSRSSDLAKTILSEVDQFIIIVFQPTILMLTNILVLVFIICYLLYTNFIASLFSLIMLITFYICFYFFSKRKLNLEGYKSEKANKGRFGSAIEAFLSIKDIKIYSAEKFFIKRFKEFSRIFASTNATYSTLVASPKYILELLVFIGLALSVLFITISNIEIFNSLPLLGIFAFAAFKAQPALSNVIYGLNSIEYGNKIINNLYNFLTSPTNNKTFEKKKTKIKNIGSKKNELIVRNLKLIYKNNKGIKNINFNVKCPSLFLLMGESGAGKSTLLNILSGNVRPESGEIFFSKRGSKALPKISYLHQEFSIINSSIAENVAFGVKKEDVDYENIKKALFSAEIYDYVYSLENNIFEIVGENGSNLSIGQRQRIALARALYFKPDILLLDEPTSSLDKETEKKIIDTVLKLSKKIIIIMSTHKLNFIPKLTTVGIINRNGIDIKETS